MSAVLIGSVFVKRVVLALVLVMTGMVVGATAADTVVLADKGQSRSVIVAPKGMMTWTKDPKAKYRRGGERPSFIKERNKVVQRDSVKDLALYLKKMSGVEVEIVEALPAGDTRKPIFIGAAAQTVFGPVGITKAKMYGFRIVCDPKPAVIIIVFFSSTLFS